MFRGDSGATPGNYWGLIVILSLGALAFFALVLGGRQRWAYLICSLALGVWSARGVYVALWYVYFLICGQPIAPMPYFHLAERNQPFVVQQQPPVLKQLLVPIIVGLFVWLFVRFAFGRPSLLYFRFDDIRKSPTDKGSLDAPN